MSRASIRTACSKSKLTYEIMKPESVGITKSSLVLGKHSGRHAFRERIEEMGYTFTDSEINLAFKRFKTLSDMKKYVYDEDIEMIIMDEIYKVPEKYQDGLPQCDLRQQHDTHGHGEA